MLFVASSTILAASSAMLAASSVVQRLDDPAVALCVLVMAGAGIKLGGFRTTLVGFGLLLALNAAIALCGWAAEMLVKLEVPQGYATVAAFLLLFLAGAAATVGAMQAFIREYAARLSPITDGILGSLSGVLAGVVIAAAVHISWSMATGPQAKEVPPDYRFKPDEVEFRVGEAMLANVAGVANSLSDELLERYRTGLWFGPLPEPEPEPEDADSSETGDDAEGEGVRPTADDAERGEPAEGPATEGSFTPGVFLPSFPAEGLGPSTPPATPGGAATPPGSATSSDSGPVAR